MMPWVLPHPHLSESSDADDSDPLASLPNVPVDQGRVPAMQCAVCSVHCAVLIVQCAVCSIQCAVCSVQCAVQSNKNPCSVAALLRGNFGSLVDFAEIFTKIHAVLLQNSLLVLHCFHTEKYILFCWKISTKTAATLLESFTKICLYG